MRQEHLLQFLQAIGAEHVRKGDRGNFQCSCPLAFARHRKGRDRNPSFSIKASETDHSVYQCFTCGAKGNLVTLISLLTRLSELQNTYSDAVALIDEYEIEPDDEGQDTAAAGLFNVKMRWRNEVMQIRKAATTIAVPPEVLKHFPYITRDDDDILEFLTIERGISLRAVAAYRLRKYDIRGRKGIIFPILSKQNEKVVLDMYVRLLEEKKFFRLSSTLVESLVKSIGNVPDYKASHLGFGNHLVDSSKPVVLVEAPLDAMMLYTRNFKNVLAMNGSMGRTQAQSFFARTAYLGFDADLEGRRFAKNAFALLKDKIPTIYQLDWSKGKDTEPNKDPSDLRTLRAIMEVFNNKRQLQGIGSSEEAA